MRRFLLIGGWTVLRLPPQVGRGILFLAILMAGLSGSRPAFAQAVRLAVRLSADQPSLASTINCALGAARRTAAMRAGSPSPPSLILRSGRSDAAAAACAMASGVANEIVYAVTSGSGAGRPASS